MPDSPAAAVRRLPTAPCPIPRTASQTYELISDAIAESQHGEYAESTEKFNQALKSDPDSVPVHYLLGLNYYRMREFPKSVEHLQRVMQLSPDYALASFQLGLAYARAGDFDHAIETLKRTLELDPSNFSAAYNLGAAYVQKQMMTEAARAFRSSVTISPEYAARASRVGRSPAVPGAESTRRSPNFVVPSNWLRKTRRTMRHWRKHCPQKV